MCDWRQIAILLTDPLPKLTSRLLPVQAGARDEGELMITTENSQQMQRILLEGMCSGSVQMPEDVQRLIQSTFVCHHVSDWDPTCNYRSRDNGLTVDAIVQWALSPARLQPITFWSI